MLRALAPLVLLAALPGAGPLPAASPAPGALPGAPPAAQDGARDPKALPSDVDDIAARIAERRDDVEPELVRRLGEARTREAMEALLAAYDQLASVYMRREVLRALAQYDAVKGAEQPALQKITDVATSAAEPELREAAVSLLGSAPSYGKAFLRMIVESTAVDDVREEAMRLHVTNPRPEDEAWYRKLWKPWTAEEDAPRPKRASTKTEAEAARTPRVLQDVRALAFEALVPSLEAEELVEAAGDSNPKIRVRAIEELEARGEKEAVPVAERVYQGEAVYDNPVNPNEKQRESSRARLAAARILLRERGADFAEDLIDDATRPGTSLEFRQGIADAVRELDSEDVRKQGLKELPRAKGAEKLFWMRVLKDVEDPKLDKALEKALEDKEAAVRRAAIDVLAERGATGVLEKLEAAIEEEENPIVLASVIDAITRLRRGDPEWNERLGQLARHEETLVRNAALEALGRSKDPAHLPLLVEALEHEQWSTRLAALAALEALREREAVGAIVARMPAETGRVRLQFAEALFRSTGQPFGRNAEAWTRWYQEEKDTFEFATDADLRRLERETERRRLKETTTTPKFFGVEIESTRVIFVLDVSGSMDERTFGQHEGERGEPRITVAKRELVKALDALGADAFFNIVTFSQGVHPWKPRISERNEATLAEAKEFVQGLRAGGGTNLFGAIDHAFDDPDVDTIFVLSDGEPSVGVIVDPLGIRSAVEARNEHRGVRIHCISIGGQLRVLEWLAQDSGGQYVEIP